MAVSKFNIPTVIVVFGATGDLAQKKIFPALFNLFKKKELPKLFKIVGAGRRSFSDDEFCKYVADVLTKFEGETPNANMLKPFLETVTYQQSQFNNLEDYRNIARLLGMNDMGWSICSNKLFYLAVPPENYESMLQNLHESGLTEPCSPEEGWTRVLIEKPLGKDAKNADRIEHMLGELFKEEQVYRIDHYLAKEMIQNILAFRFSNNLMEESWSNRFVEKIEVRMLENFGVENRGAFYDGLGALRDVGQNHILQMLALATMERPQSFTSEHIRAKRRELLGALRYPDAAHIAQNTFRAQYDGYRAIKGVAADSDTETYFKVKAYIDNPRWEGVPIIMESGKRLGVNKNEIIVTFKKVPMTMPKGFDDELRNRVVFSIDPVENIDIAFVAKKPGLKMELEQRELEFVYRNAKAKAEEYERVLLDCIRGDQMLFVTTEEVDAMWGFIDPIVTAWRENVVPLHTYAPDSGAIREKAAIVEERRVSSRMRKEIGVIGLGKMGSGVALQLVEKGWKVHGWNRTASVTGEYEKQGIYPAATPADLVKSLPAPRVIWLMVPAGKPVDEMIFGEDGIAQHMEPGDVIIDGGNSFFKDATPRAKKLKAMGISYMDVGTSGGPAGARHGACLMIGGERATYEMLVPLFADLSLPQGFRFFEGYGAGHFVKMVHNGIEYGMMQAIAEGFAVMKASDYDLNLTDVADIYNHGSVVESRLVGWMERGFRTYGEDLEAISGSVAHTGEGAWTVKTAEELGIPVPIIKGSLDFRIQSEKNPSYIGKLLSTLRNMFGGHSVKK
jgi:glucose-6-phosphate 1-dehydrogenase